MAAEVAKAAQAMIRETLAARRAKANARKPKLHHGPRAASPATETAQALAVDPQRAIGGDDARRRGKLIMARYRPQQRDRAQAKQARELAKAAAKKAAAANKVDKPTAAEVLKAAMERR
jgi:hypothetical protein